MSTPTLRALAKAYSDKLIDRKAYIRERRRLIDDIESGDAEVIPYGAPPTTPEASVERTFSDGEATFEIAQKSVETSDEPAPLVPKKSRFGMLLTAAVITAIVVFAWWKRAGEQQQAMPQHVDATPPATSIPKTNPAEALLENFLDANQWRDEAIDDFLLRWLDQPPGARDALADSPLMGRANDIITQKFLEEKALLDLGAEADAMAAQRRLLDLASALSISNDRTERQENEWQAHHEDMIAGETDVAATAQATEVETRIEEATVLTAALTTNHEPTTVSSEVTAVGTGTAVDGETGAAPTEVRTTTAVAAAVPDAGTPTSAPTGSVTAATDDNAVPTDGTPGDPPAVSPPVTPVAAALDAAPANRETAAVAVAAPAVRNTHKSSGCRAEIALQRRPYCRDLLGPKLKGPPLVVLPAGEIEVGGRNPEEQPRHRVTIPRPFGIGVFEVSFEEFRVFCQATKRECPAQPWSDPKLPVVNVPWSMVAEYLEWLSAMSGATYRLPSESEWEYATRGGTTTAYPFGDEVLPTHARFSFRTPETTPLPATDRAVNRNKFRLYHTIGNVREWVLDVWHENHAGAPLDGSARKGDSSERVARGGSYSDGADQIRSASRIRLAADAGDPRTGFRVLREIE